MRLRAIRKPLRPKLVDPTLGLAIMAALIFILPWAWIWPVCFALLWQKRFPATRTFALSMFTFSFLLFLLSAYARLSLVPPPPPMEFQYFQNVEFPYEMPAPFTSRHYNDGGILDYNVQHGRLGLRGDNLDTPLQKGQILVAALGCSFTYGTGVEESETFPQQLTVRSNGKFRVLNFGVRGGSVHNLIAITFNLEHYFNRAGREITDPILVFTTFEEHIDRFAGTGHFGWFALEPPVIARRDDGTFWAPPQPWHFRIKQFVRKSLGRQLWGLLNKSVAKAYAGLAPPDAFSAEAVNLFLDGIKFAEKEFHRNYPRGRFIVNSWSENPDFLAILGTLPEPIEVIHMRGVSELPAIPIDGHPAAAAHAGMAEFLREALSRSPAPASRQH